MILRRFQLTLIVAIALLSTHSSAATNLADCALIDDRDQRLACYDELARPQAPSPAASSEPTLEEQEVHNNKARARQKLLAGERLRQEVASGFDPFILTPHRRNYLLPVTYNNDVNRPPWDKQYPEDDMKHVEAKFQFSVKALILNDILWRGTSLWGGYTQTNWWQVYNESSPLREINYQPELFVNFKNDWEIGGYTNTLLRLGFVHQSNGQGGELSRSWNRIMGSAIFERERMTLNARAWYRIPESDDDNEDILKYYGYGDLSGVWKYRQHEFSVMLRNNLRSDNKGAIELEWTFPLSPRFKGYIQYFNGYGESLIDHDLKTNRIGFGISLTDLL